MRKLIASINMTLDGFCDHTAVIADEEMHQHVNDLFKTADTTIFGRVTYQLMESGWPPIVKEPTGVKAIDEFAILIDTIHKIVFSHTLKGLTWKNSTLAKGELKAEIIRLKQQPGKNILVGSPSLIVALTQFGLIDEYQLCIQPIILGKGLILFKHMQDRIDLKCIRTETYASGAILARYEPATKNQ
ncbi:dihydrofolate reductase family protein [Cytophaga hutchinsonii]|nr:dihydrofolate reductase family protein [Cytophaga hutchinsonii]SFX19819.1 dihydrofolate reductase [Cytophaga hutchinsonii ATCC 33406]